MPNDYSNEIKQTNIYLTIEENDKIDELSKKQPIISISFDNNTQYLSESDIEEKIKKIFQSFYRRYCINEKKLKISPNDSINKLFKPAVFVDAPPGSGKTTFIMETTSYFKEKFKSKKILILCNRKALQIEIKNIC